MIRVVNLRNYKLNDNETLIKIDRTSPVGNLYHINKKQDRDNVCDKYEQYFNKRLNEDEDKSDFVYYISLIIQTCQSGNDVALGCWCYPNRCHGETIIKHVKQQLSIE